MTEIKILDYTKAHSGKWYEVGFLCTEDRNEKIEIIAKFISKVDAKSFSEMYSKTNTGYIYLIIR